MPIPGMADTRQYLVAVAVRAARKQPSPEQTVDSVRPIRYVLVSRKFSFGMKLNPSTCVKHLYTQAVWQFWGCDYTCIRWKNDRIDPLAERNG